MNKPTPENEALTVADVAIFEHARQAVESLRRTFDTWITIGHAVILARQIADRRGGSKTFMRILEREGIRPALGKSAKAMASNLQRIIERLPEVVAWRKTLTPNKQIEWAAPSTVITHCPIFAKEKANNGKPKRVRLIPVDDCVESLRTHLANTHDADHRRSIIERIVGKQREDGDLFKPNDTANDIATVIVGMFTKTKAENIARAILKLLKDRATSAIQAAELPQ